MQKDQLRWKHSKNKHKNQNPKTKKQPTQTNKKTTSQTEAQRGGQSLHRNKVLCSALVEDIRQSNVSVIWLPEEEREMRAAYLIGSK